MDIKQQEAALKLSAWLLNPDGGGYMVGPWERDLARIVVGIAPVECVEKPRIKHFCGGGWICISSRVAQLGSTPVDAYAAWMLAHV